MLTHGEPKTLGSRLVKLPEFVQDVEQDLAYELEASARITCFHGVEDGSDSDVMLQNFVKRITAHDLGSMSVDILCNPLRSVLIFDLGLIVESRYIDLRAPEFFPSREPSLANCWELYDALDLPECART
jgi:hypothetical protein